jgi:hypothetical protein
MKIPEIRVIAASALAGTTMVFADMPAAMAHWGHLGELAGHGHLAGLALGAAAAIMAAALVAKGRDEAGRDEVGSNEAGSNEAGSNEGAGDPAPGADGQPEGKTADA